MKEQRLREIYIGLLALFTYFFVSLTEGVPFALLKIDIKTLPENIKIIYSLGCELFILSIILLLFKDKIKRDIQDMKQNYQQYFKNSFKYYLYGLGIMMVSNLVLSFLTGGIAGNEEAIRSILGNHPIYMWISGVLIAPLMEELLFRQAIRFLFKNKWAFILISGFIFGGLHVIGTIEETNTVLENIYNFLYIIPYSALGLVFAYMLDKYDNIFVSTGYHFMHNGVALSLQILILLFS